MNYNQSNNIKLSYKHNTISFRHKSQQRKVTDVVPLNKELLDNPQKYLSENLSHGEKVILNHYLALANTFQDIYFSQSTIAKKTGYSREYVNRKLKKLRTHGLLDYNYNHMNTCDYKISSWFSIREIREKLKDLFSSLHYLPLIWIIASNAVFQLDGTQYINIRESHRENWTESYLTFEFNELNRVDYNKKRENLDMTAFIQALDSSDNHSHNDLIPPYIHQLQPIFNLTTHGKYYLSSYPLAALQYASQPLIKAQPTSIWRYFDKILKNYCEQQNVEPNWQILHDLPREVIDQPMVVKETGSIDKRALKNWLSGTQELAKQSIKRNTTSQPTTQRTWVLGKRVRFFCCDDCLDKYCCGTCEINKLFGPLASSGKMQICEKIIKQLMDSGQPLP